MLANPIFLRGAVVLFFSVFAFFFALFLMRKLRQSITEESEISAEGSATMETLPLHVFNTVIHQLKQQQQELKSQSEAEQTRARANENVNQAVISNLSCGVLIFGTNGLIKTSNPAAKTILGFISPAGMSADDIFRGAVISRQSGADADDLSTSNSSTNELSNDSVCVADEVAVALRPGNHRRRVEAEYETPAGDRRFLAVTVSPVPAEDGNLLGVACVIDDRSELELIRQSLPPRQEIAAAGVGVGSTIS
jgi:nitrogen fixation/metabolism regulation signal transduction histidine kinase